MIGLFGGTCNNMYVFAKELAKDDFDVVFIEDRKDNFPHSQPVWDDVDVFWGSGFDYREIDWKEFEIEQGWEKPTWYYQPEVISGGEKEIYKESNLSILVRFFACRFLRSYKVAYSVYKKMTECDFLIVCGIEAAILAMLSGKPYVVFPHGSDMRVAIGAQQKGEGWKGRIIEWLTTYSFTKALRVVSSLPDGSAEVDKSEYKRLKDLDILRIPLPYQMQERLPKERRQKMLESIARDFGYQLPEAEYYCFSPSRINFYWKGHDKFLDVIKGLPEESSIHFIFLGWGDDYVEAMDYVKKNSIENRVTILPVFLSKKRLFSMFRAVDFIVDELNGSGSYGTSLSEAISVGCPVVTWISDMFDQPGWSRPPVIQARTNIELEDVLSNISEGRLDLDEQGEILSKWFSVVHEREAVLKTLESSFGEYL